MLPFPSTPPSFASWGCYGSLVVCILFPLIFRTAMVHFPSMKKFTLLRALPVSLSRSDLVVHVTLGISCFTDCSAEAVVCVERVQMAVMRNSVHTATLLISYTHTHKLICSQHTQCGKLGCSSTWNNYSSSNERAAGWVFIEYSLNRDGQANTPAQMSVFSSGCVCACVRVCVSVCIRSLFSSWTHSDIPIMKVTDIIHLRPWLQLTKPPQRRLFHGWMALSSTSLKLCVCSAWPQ